jgi:sugar phosphate isomerase/epimerase
MTDFSYQLYSSRNFGPLSKTLRMLGQLGYAQVEGYGGLYANLAQIDQLKADLAANHLHMATGHFGYDMVKGEPKRVLEIARALNMRGIFVPAPPTPDYREGKGDWPALGKGLAEAGKPYWDAGYEFGYHNHHWEWGGSQGSRPIDVLLDADPRLKLELDIAWAVKGGQDAKAVLAAYASRIYAVHVKDMAPAGENANEDGWADVGTGTMGWAELLPAAKAAGANYLVLEHDNPSDDRRFAGCSIAAMKAM